MKLLISWSALLYQVCCLTCRMTGYAITGTFFIQAGQISIKFFIKLMSSVHKRKTDEIGAKKTQKIPFFNH
jgi:hypothetical protein